MISYSRFTWDTIRKILQLVVLANLGVLGHIDGELEVSTAIETNVFAIDEDSSFVIYGTEVKQDLLAVPG
jgi:hypothetical protein